MCAPKCPAASLGGVERGGARGNNGHHFAYGFDREKIEIDSVRSLVI
jgi:hypothetical protein